MPRVHSYRKLSRTRLMAIIEDGYGLQRRYTKAQAARAAEELESREMGYQTWHARHARENSGIGRTAWQKVGQNVAYAMGSLRAARAALNDLPPAWSDHEHDEVWNELLRIETQLNKIRLRAESVR